MPHTHRATSRPAGERGIALLTVMLMLMVLAVIGIASITLTGLENRLAGYVRAGEAAGVAAQACLSTSVTTLEATIRDSNVPDALLDNASTPGPVPNANRATLLNEVLGAVGYENYNDTLPGTYPNFNLGIPSPSQTLNSFVVQGDIDRLYSKAGTGGSMLMIQGYEGVGAGSGTGGTEILYQISCLATNSATNVRSKITAIYACKPVADGCLRKI
ncbi:MAG: pilus assembly PilX family protein [Nitrospiraceae bacterium]